jgi:predicted transcriptional regulator
LKVHKGATLSQSQIAREAGIPVGSIVASIKRLLEVRRVIQVERGMYQMT